MSEGMDVPEGGNRTLNRMVATTVVALSVVMAVGKIKDDNIVQAMQADQAAKIDLWGEYQSTRIKAHDQQIAATLLRRMPGVDADATQADRESARYAAEAKGIKAKAQAASDDYDVQGHRDDQLLARLHDGPVDEGHAPCVPGTEANGLEEFVDIGTAVGTLRYFRYAHFRLGDRDRGGR